MTATVHDPGGKVRLPLAPTITASAIFGGDRDQYRYRLTRAWAPDAARRMVLFVMMNPSTADASVDDPTVAKCGRYARAWGYGGLMVCNVFAYRATDQRELAKVADPIGPDNDKWLKVSASAAEKIVMAYGTPREPRLRERGVVVARTLSLMGFALHVLALSQGGIPMHPLYLRGDLQPQPWEPR